MTMKQSQNRRLLEYLKANKSITSMAAFAHLGITSLHRRLSDLKKHGVSFKSKWSDDAGNIRYKIYSLSK